MNMIHKITKKRNGQKKTDEKEEERRPYVLYPLFGFHASKRKNQNTKRNFAQLRKPAALLAPGVAVVLGFASILFDFEKSNHWCFRSTHCRRP